MPANVYMTYGSRERRSIPPASFDPYIFGGENDQQTGVQQLQSRFVCNVQLHLPLHTAVGDGSLRHVRTTTSQSQQLCRWLGTQPLG